MQVERCGYNRKYTYIQTRKKSTEKAIYREINIYQKCENFYFLDINERKILLWIFVSHLLIFVQKDFIPTSSSFCVCSSKFTEKPKSLGIYVLLQKKINRAQRKIHRKNFCPKVARFFVMPVWLSDSLPG